MNCTLPLLAAKGSGSCPRATPDGVHLTPEYCQIWMDYLKTHTVQA